MLIFDDLNTCINSYYKPRLKLFKKLLGERVIDILLHMPSATIEKLYVEQVCKDNIGKIITTKAKVDCLDINFRSTRPAIVYAKNGSEIIEILLFNYKKAYVTNAYPVGQEITISGKLGVSFSGVFQFINPEKSIASKNDENVGLFNIYPLTTGLTQKSIYSAMKSAIKILEREKLQEWIPEEALKSNGFVSFSEALKNIHYPTKIYETELENPFRRRLAFDELLAEQIVIRNSTQKTKDGYAIKNDKKLIRKLLEILPFELTKSQNKVISEIFKDLESSKPMMRLLQGDVGSGKTIVALISALYAIESGYQCAILAPTEILARQHYQTFHKYLSQIGLSVELLTINEKGKKRTEILEHLASGNLNILVGTHAIITDKVKFKNLGLVIVDEQHRFGVHQRLQLIQKGISPHVLSMTATPIPRTVIMSLYGDINVSSITEKPTGRKEIITKAIPLGKIMEIVSSIKNIISKNQRIYWICPLIEENEKLEYTCVINRFNFLKQYFGNEVGMLHGKMKTNEKQEIFKRFNNGNCKILVSTTVIEVGVDVPEACVIIIENAEKFGLAQLHQLRGRVGRSDLQSYCILLFDAKLSEIASKRLEIIQENSDGFKIAEQDLLLRGGGEIFGTRQSGQKVYRTFDVSEPSNQTYILNLLEQTSSLATKIVDSDQIENYKLLLKIFDKENVEETKKSF